MCSSWLLSTPPEIRYAIYQWLDTRSKMVLRKVCTQFRDEIQPLLTMVATIRNENDLCTILERHPSIKGARIMTYSIGGHCLTCSTFCVFKVLARLQC